MGAGHLSAGSRGHSFPLRAPLPPAVHRTLCGDVSGGPGEWAGGATERSGRAPPSGEALGATSAETA